MFAWWHSAQYAVHRDRHLRAFGTCGPRSSVTFHQATRPPAVMVLLQSSQWTVP